VRDGSRSASSWMESAPMSLAASQRRDQRRRLVVSWNRSATTPASSVAESRRLADYSPEALPEHQPSLATLLPTGLGGFSLAALGLLTLLAAAVGVGVWEMVARRPVFSAGSPRFAATLGVLRQCLDLRTFLSIGGWLAQLCLISAAATALIVRLMRRHRRDDYRGRYRAWGWLAGLFMLTACAGQVPVGPLVAAIASDATGITLGPDGMGWWVLTAGLLYAAVSLWAVLPLHERFSTGVWLSLCLGAWAAAAACGWMGRGGNLQGRDSCLVIGNTCWMAGGALAAIAMLAAARSVLREVRGLPAQTAASTESAATESDQTVQKTTAVSRIVSDDRDAVERRSGNTNTSSHTSKRDEHDADGDDGRGETGFGETGFGETGEESEADDEAGQSGRHLSKSERKRLKKLARMGRAA